MKPHEEYAESIVKLFDDLDSAHTSKSDKGFFYHDKKECAIIVIEKQIDLINEIAVQSMAEVVVRKHKLLNKALKYLKNK